MATDAPLPAPAPAPAAPRAGPSWRTPLRWAVTVVTWVLLALAWLAIRLVPFRRLAPVLGRRIGAVTCTPLADARQEKRAIVIAHAIIRAVPYAPFRADCLRQALAGVVMCRLLGVPTATHLGVRLGAIEAPIAGDPMLNAHAWVCVGRVDLCGGRGAGDFVPVSCFVTSGRR